MKQALYHKASAQMSAQASSKLLRIKYYAATAGREGGEESTSSSLDHPSKSPWRSGTRQACWGILRGQDMKKRHRDVSGMRQRGEEMKGESEQGYKRDKSSGKMLG